MSDDAAPQSRLGIWIMASRLRTLPAAIAPVLIGCAMVVADGGFHAAAAAAALIGAILIQIGTNYANDYFDFVNGADTEARVGPTRATAAGLISPASMRTAFIVTFALTVPIIAYLAVRGGWPVVAIGVASILSGILYTGGPRPLGYMGLGDVFVLVFFGPIAVAGTYYVQSLTLSWEAVIAGLAPGLISTAILVVNNLRDIETDADVGKNTLAVRFGPGFARGEYLTALLVAATVPPILIYRTGEHWLALSACLILIPAAPIVSSMWTEQGRALDPNLARTGRLLALYSILFSAGWVLG
ncbi:MAG: 1,4-dihydroxy-2-naphthoate octaprenyltransferase [Myxococcota bacterium]|jgi:1,4-dihydroxy-2-naphthoate octaprenyltransferase